jgi:hypothetical protein
MVVTSRQLPSIDRDGDAMTACKNLRRKAASQYLEDKYGIHRAPATLAKLAVIGGGPPFRRDGRTPLYSTDDLDQWAISRLSAPMRSTSEGAPARANTTPQSRDLPDSHELGGVS